MQPIDTLTIESHPPERRRRTEIRMCHGSCCCCCCLHTIGGIIGSAVAPAIGKGDSLAIDYYYDDAFDGASPHVAKPRISAVKVFWLLTLAAVPLLWGIGSSYMRGGPGHEALMEPLLFLVLGFPAVQLFTALVTLIWLGISSRPDKSYQLWQLGKITLGLFLGTGAGIAAMFVIAKMMH